MIINCGKEPNVLPIERGGTGANNVLEALRNLFGENALPVEYGGTGAKTIEGILNNLGIDDHIVQTGWQGRWQYVKLASGIAFCYTRFDETLAINTAQGSFYYGVLLNREDYPYGLFATTPSEFYSMHNSGVLCWVETGSNNTQTQTGMYRVMKETKTDKSYDFVLDLLVIGKWKTD